MQLRPPRQPPQRPLPRMRPTHPSAVSSQTHLPHSVMIQLPTISGLILRRLLVNYRGDRGAIALTLPPPFRPKHCNNRAGAGICLIGLRSVRPSCLPPFLGLSSENAAHRIAVDWNDGGQTKEGGYVPR